MEKAYVLLNVELGSEREVQDSLKEIPEVKEVHKIYGVYDLIICVEAETMEDLKDLVEHRVRVIGKIRSTLTMICIKEGDVQVGIGKGF
ncbi:hypothetical protein ES703_16531 [subsurface metagenome]